MTSLVDLLDAEKNISAPLSSDNGIILVLPKTLSEGYIDMIKRYLSEFKRKQVVKNLRASSNAWIGKADITHIICTGKNPAEWFVLVKGYTLSFKNCGYVNRHFETSALERVDSQTPMADYGSQAL